MAEEQEILDGQRAFPEAQRLFAGEVERDLSQTVRIGWHDTATSPYAGAFAVVKLGGTLDDLIGEVVRVRVGRRQALVYVVGSADVPVELSLARRAMLALAPLALEAVKARVGVVGPA